MAIVLGSVLDGIPESFVLGLTILQGGVSLSLLAGVALSNLCAARTSSQLNQSMRRAGHGRSMLAFRSVVSVPVSFVRSFSTNSRPALRAAACGGRPRPAAPRLLLGKNLGGWRGLVRTAIVGTTVTVGLSLLSLLLLPRWLNSTSWLRTR